MKVVLPASNFYDLYHRKDETQLKRDDTGQLLWSVQYSPNAFSPSNEIVSLINGEQHLFNYIIEIEGITCRKILNLAPNPYALPDEISPAFVFIIECLVFFFTEPNRNHQWNHC